MQAPNKEGKTDHVLMHDAFHGGRADCRPFPAFVALHTLELRAGDQGTACFTFHSDPPVMHSSVAICTFLVDIVSGCSLMGLR